MHQHTADERSSVELKNQKMRIVLAAALMWCVSAGPTHDESLYEHQEAHYVNGVHNPEYHHLEAELDAHKQEFDDMDVNFDGALSFSELESSAAKELGISSHDIEAFLEDLDADGSGDVSWEEYVDALFGQEFSESPSVD